MGVFTVALSAWAVATTAGAPDTGGLEPEAAPVSTVADEGLVAAMPEEMVAGFRMEGAAELDIVFGDVDRYRRHIDRFFDLEEQLEATRRRFSRHVKAAIELVSENRRGRCPYDLLGPHFYQAEAEGESFRALGAAFEREYQAIRRLDRYGDSASLTPAYRWKVNRARALYSRSLTDYREMRFSFLDELGAELGARGCQRTRLLAAGKKAPAAAPDEVQAPYKAPTYRRRKGEKVSEHAAIPATFFIDNRHCRRPMQVYVDGALVGEVAGASHTAFQTTTGRHTLCLIEPDSVKKCGEPGTLRSSYFHDGWSIGLNCE